MCVPDAYVVSIDLALPGRLFSTTVYRVRRPSIIVAQFQHDIFHDGLQLLQPVVFGIEEAIDDHGIDASVIDYVADLCRHITADMLV